MAIIKILLITLLTYVLGYFWYSKFDKQNKIHLRHDRKYLITEFILMFVTNFLLYFITLASDSMLTASVTTVLVWLGFVLTTNISIVMWNRDKHMTKDIVINSIYRLLSMVIAVMIFFVWK